jgi:pimeloyl-ACP methyl ester carboxylesterase
MTINLEASTGVAESGWNEPEGIGPRGTVIILGGRGESGPTYGRFGTRIAADAYRVRTVSGVVDPAVALERITELLDDASLPSPRILVGSDSGAALALELAAGGLPVDAIILAGLPAGSPADVASWEDELAARTACPNHQGVLSRTAERGAITATLPFGLLGVVASAVAVPVLAIHGEADALAPLDAALEVYSEIPLHEVAVIASGRHDILNDITHRSVAATVILFLERLRLDPALSPIVQTR